MSGWIPARRATRLNPAWMLTGWRISGTGSGVPRGGYPEAVANCGPDLHLLRMTEELQARNAQRQAFLRMLYDRVDSSVTEFVSAFEIGEAMGLARMESSRIVAYLEEKGLLFVDDHTTGLCRLTAEGVDRVELAG